MCIHIYMHIYYCFCFIYTHNGEVIWIQLVKWLNLYDNHVCTGAWICARDVLHFVYANKIAHLLSVHTVLISYVCVCVCYALLYILAECGKHDDSCASIKVLNSICIVACAFIFCMHKLHIYMCVRQQENRILNGRVNIARNFEIRFPCDCRRSNTIDLFAFTNKLICVLFFFFLFFLVIVFDFLRFSRCHCGLFYIVLITQSNLYIRIGLTIMSTYFILILIYCHSFINLWFKRFAHFVNVCVIDATHAVQKKKKRLWTESHRNIHKSTHTYKRLDEEFVRSERERIHTQTNTDFNIVYDRNSYIAIVISEFRIVNSCAWSVRQRTCLCILHKKKYEKKNNADISIDYCAIILVSYKLFHLTVGILNQ